MMKKTREFHDNESENISGETIGGAALIRERHLLIFFVPNAALNRGYAFSIISNLFI